MSVVSVFDPENTLIISEVNKVAELHFCTYKEEVLGEWRRCHYSFSTCWGCH
jgi:hypothetical protein